MRLIIPKATSEQARWQQALNSGSISVEFVDPWELTVLTETPEHKSHWLNIDEFSAVVCISPTAAQVLIDALDDYWPMPPAEVRWLCNGPRTARVLESVGLIPLYPATDFTTEAVLQLPEADVTQHEKWLVIKGIGGRDAYRVGLQGKGAVVTELEVYRRELNQAALQRIVSLSANCDAIWLSSEFLGDALMSQANMDWSAWSGQWWVSSPRLAEWALQHDLNNVIMCSGATAEALNDHIIQHVS